MRRLRARKCAGEVFLQGFVALPVAEPEGAGVVDEGPFEGSPVADVAAGFELEAGYGVMVDKDVVGRAEEAGEVGVFVLAGVFEEGVVRGCDGCRAGGNCRRSMVLHGPGALAGRLGVVFAVELGDCAGFRCVGGSAPAQVSSGEGRASQWTPSSLWPKPKPTWSLGVAVQ